ncbi:MAG: DUF72 domain-containing protein [Chthoniobacterales bacterium]|nr:DUF72 domain-containing protein [Chthoniobacterales bacterium]
MALFVGTAGWSLPRAEQREFPGSGSHLERYAARFLAAEINSSFHRTHREATWIRWRQSVPSDFRFSVKMPKAITHTARLADCDTLIAAFLKEIATLGGTLGCLLVQLPPSLGFVPDLADRFFSALRTRTALMIACEPRHESWFAADADALLLQHHIARVAADPARVPVAAEPGGWRDFTYYRLHGSPKIYYSAYESAVIATLAARVRKDLSAARTVWAIFGNTTLGAATRNALDLTNALI